MKSTTSRSHLVNRAAITDLDRGPRSPLMLILPSDEDCRVEMHLDVSTYLTDRFCASLKQKNVGKKNL